MDYICRHRIEEPSKNKREKEKRRKEKKKVPKLTTYLKSF
jgi:hypothetical protein